VPFKAKSPVKRKPPHDPKDAGLVWVPNPGTRKETWKLVRATTGLGQIQDPLGAALGEPSYFDLGWENCFVSLCEAIGTNPYDFAGVIMNESQWNPSATNSIGCVGLIQFCSSSFGVFSSDYSSSQFAQLTVSEQIPYLWQYITNWMNQYNLITISARDIYWLMFLPATYVPNSPDSYVISTSGDAYYSSNQSLDPNGTGQITAGDLMKAIYTSL
jgi:hypothetical protein